MARSSKQLSTETSPVGPERNGEVEYEIIHDEIVPDDEAEGMDTVLGFLLPASQPGEVDDSSASSEQVS